jgi:UDP-N-acetyl-D-glucosamine dehydrogenase
VNEAGVINAAMPELTVQMVADALNEHQKPVKGSKILVLGVAYTPDIDDVRESPAVDVLELLHKRGGKISYHDPYVPKLTLREEELTSEPLLDLVNYDCVVIVTHHKTLDYGRICIESQLIVDTRNATKPYRSDFPHKIVTL